MLLMAFSRLSQSTHTLGFIFLQANFSALLQNVENKTVLGINEIRNFQCLLPWNFILENFVACNDIKKH